MCACVLSCICLCVSVCVIIVLSLYQVSRCIAGPLAFKWPVADCWEEHDRGLQEVQQQHRRRDHPLLFTGRNASGVLPLDIWVLTQRASGTRYTRWIPLLCMCLGHACVCTHVSCWVCIYLSVCLNLRMCSLLDRSTRDADRSNSHHGRRSKVQ